MAVPADTAEALARDAVIWAAQNGLLYGLKEPKAANIHAPVALVPVRFPKDAFEHVSGLMTDFSLMVDAIARDEEYLKATLASAAQYDEFTANLLKVFEATTEARASNREGELVLGVHRSDYMLDEGCGGFLQVELNTIASSFGCLSGLVSRLHAHLLARTPSLGLDAAHLPSNTTRDAIASAIHTAHKAFLAQNGSSAAGAVALMVVQPGETNIFDQEWISTALWTNHGVRMVRHTLAEIATQGEIQDGTLHVGGTPVSVAYFRAGYTPDDYPTQTEWDARVLVESSSAAKCPSVAYQLTGAKKIQQDLAAPGVVERFVPDAGTAAAIRTLFAGLWSLDDLSDPATKEVVERAMASPSDFVLKPQREGGGNNLYDEELVAKLSEGRGLAAYILMQRIRPPTNKSLLLRAGEWVETDTLSELGIYGTFLRRGDAVLLNRQVGHLVRTKASTSNEGGVAAGFAVLDSPYLA